MDEGLNLLPLIRSGNGMSVLRHDTNHIRGMGLCHPLNDGVIRLAVDFMEDPAGMIGVVCLDLNLHRSLDQAENVLRMHIGAGCSSDGEHRRREKRAMVRPNFHQFVRCTAVATAAGGMGCRDGHPVSKCPRHMKMCGI